MLDILLAMALIMGDPDDTHLVDQDVAGWCLPTIRELSLTCQWADEREMSYFLKKYEDAKSDLTNLRRRYRNLKDAPPAEDSHRFPHRTIISEYMSLNRAYRRHIDVLMQTYPHRYMEYRDVIQETDKLYELWDSVRDATSQYYYVSVRRQSLKLMREQLGPKDYYNGNLPPPLPLWRFQEIK